MSKKPYPKDAAFDAWVASLPEKHWAKYDLSACRLGWEAHKTASTPKPISQLPSIQAPNDGYECHYCHFIISELEWKAFHFLPSCPECGNHSFEERKGKS